MPAWLVSNEESFLAYNGYLLTVSSHDKETKREHATLMTLPKPNSLPEVPSAAIFTLGVRASTYGFG